MFRADAELDRLARRAALGARERNDRIGDVDAVSREADHIHDVHPRRADEACDEQIVGIFVDLARAHVDFAEYLGSTRYLYCNLASGEGITVEQRDGRDFSPGEEIWLHCDAECLRLFSPAGERLRAGAPERVATA